MTDPEEIHRSKQEDDIPLILRPKKTFKLFGDFRRKTNVDQFGKKIFCTRPCQKPLKCLKLPRKSHFWGFNSRYVTYARMSLVDQYFLKQYCLLWIYLFDSDFSSRISEAWMAKNIQFFVLKTIPKNILNYKKIKLSMTVDLKFLKKIILFPIIFN